MIQKALTNRRIVYNITKCIITFILVALICFGCSSDDGGGSSGPIDSDGDGVIDSEDNCPNTPPGNTVDENGCTTPRFTDMDDGTVQDNETGLIWFKDANALRTNMDWYYAMDTVASLGSGEYGLSDGSVIGDWRLPTKEEWEAFFNLEYFAPVLSNTIGDGEWSEGDAFERVESYYWSSTTYDLATHNVWVANMHSGIMFTHLKTTKRFLWPVRLSN